MTYFRCLSVFAKSNYVLKHIKIKTQECSKGKIIFLFNINISPFLFINQTTLIQIFFFPFTLHFVPSPLFFVCVMLDSFQFVGVPTGETLRIYLFFVNFCSPSFLIIKKLKK